MNLYCDNFISSCKIFLTDEAGEVHLEVSDKVLLAELQDGGVAGERQQAPLPVAAASARGRHVGDGVVQGHHAHRVVVVVIVIVHIWNWQENPLQLQFNCSTVPKLCMYARTLRLERSHALS